MSGRGSRRSQAGLVAGFVVFVSALLAMMTASFIPSPYDVFETFFGPVTQVVVILFSAVGLTLMAMSIFILRRGYRR